MKFGHAILFGLGAGVTIYAIGTIAWMRLNLCDCKEVSAGGVRSPGAAPSDYKPLTPSSEGDLWFVRPQEQRTWADLFAACRITDAWLGADIDGRPVCYPVGQKAAP